MPPLVMAAEVKLEHRALNQPKNKKDRPPPAVFSDNPEVEIEEQLRNHPENSDAKVDIGSDESMDASDPSSVVQPKHDEPVPSSGFEDEDDNGQNGR
jgi:hypothetical protein